MHLKCKVKISRVIQKSEYLAHDCLWKSMLMNLSPSMIKFICIAQLNTLPSPVNLKRWKISRSLPDGFKKVSDKCSLCNQSPATLGHVLCFCTYVLNDANFNRPKWRHDRVLVKLLNDIKLLNTNFEIHADLSGFHYDLSNLINTVQEPDLVLVCANDRHLILLELSCCNEEYADSRHKEELQRYERLVCALKSINCGVHFYAVELTARGIVTVVQKFSGC
ncbi:hypothetical protein RCL1_003180 [Eukaryota sp. TZLM3-RCL]